MGTPIYKPNSNYGIRQIGTNSSQATAYVSVPPDPSRSFTSVTYQNSYGQDYIDPSLRRHGYPTFTKTTSNEPFFEERVVRYPAIAFKDAGFFNGFPFQLQEKHDYLNVPKDEIGIGSTFSFLPSGIVNRSQTGIYVDESKGTTRILGNLDSLEDTKSTFKPLVDKAHERSVAANQYWNLAAIETDWVIKTKNAPSTYDTGYCKNPDGSSSEGMQLVTEDYEVVESYNEETYPPHLRQYHDPSGDIQFQSINEDGLIVGSGQDFSSCFFLGHDTGYYANAFFPLTIQPDNTGAFVITLDEGVANFFEDQAAFGTKSPFNCNMMFDFNIKNKDDEGFQRNAIEYHSFPTKAYIIPAAGWEFEVVCSKVKGIYYQYPLNPQKRYPGDQTSYINYRPISDSQENFTLIHPSHTNENHGNFEIDYNGLPLTHMPFENAPDKGTLNTQYGYYYELNPGLTYLDPVLGSNGSDSIHRQSWNQYTSPSFFPCDGTSDQVGKQFYVAAPRDSIVVDNNVLPHLDRQKDLNSRMSNQDQINITDFTNTPYFASSSVNNPRKRKDKMVEEILDIRITDDRKINVKVRDLTKIAVNNNPQVGCGIRRQENVNTANPELRDGIRAARNSRPSNVGSAKSANWKQQT